MEILRFNEAESNTPKRKRNSRGMIALGLVATLFGVGSALASSTISINSGDPINVGQGVSLVTACDEDNSIDIRFGTALKGKTEIEADDDVGVGLDKTKGELRGKPVFFTNNIVLSKVDGRANDEETGFGCGTQYFSLQVYYNPSNDDVADVVKPYTCGQLGLRGGDNVVTGDNTNTGTGISEVTCTTPGTIKFKVDTNESLDPAAVLNSTLTLPLGKKVKEGSTILDKALDISYFTLVSSNS